MLHKKTLSNDSLMTNLNGVTRAEGAAGGGSSTDWADAAATFETDGVAIGDVIFIDGQAENTVAAITDETNIVLDDALVGSPTATSWRITHSRLCEWADVKDFARDPKTGRVTIIYESDDLTVVVPS
jgi:hypothetical protein